MPLDQVNNGDSGTNARGKINTAIAQIDTNTTAIATKQPLDAELTALAALGTNGIIAKIGAGTMATRTITGTANKITVSDGDGVSSNPTLTIGTDVVTLTDTQTLTNKTITTPLGLVKGDVGLGNVDNTSDVNKPVSTATQTALNLKQDASAISTLYYDLSLSEAVSRNLAGSDLNKLITFTPPGVGVVLTFPAGLSAFPIGGMCFVQNEDASAFSIALAAGGGATLSVGAKGLTMAAGDTACVIKVTATDWLRLF